MKLANGTRLAPQSQIREYRNVPDANSATGGRDLSGEISLDLPPGTYELTFNLDGGVIAEEVPLQGPMGTPGQKTRWIKPIQTWTCSIRHELKIMPRNVPVVAMVTDGQLDPVAAGAVKPPRLMVLRRDKRTTIDIAWNGTTTPPVAVCMDVSLEIAGRAYGVGHFYRIKESSGWTTGTDLAALPADVTKVDVILRPDTKLAEDQTQATAIWGKQIVFHDVPLRATICRRRRGRRRAIDPAGWSRKNWSVRRRSGYTGQAV